MSQIHLERAGRYARLDEETAYTDTICDLSGGLTGSVLAAVLTVTILWRYQKEPGTNWFR